jgi:eukaryotic-like serine/threonine-protein kinase
MRRERDLSAEQWRQLAIIFHQVVALAPALREPIIAELCGADRDLEHELRQVLLGARTGLATELFGEAIERLVAPIERDLRGRVFGGYRLMQRVDAGGMGVVYRAERDVVGGQVAVKVLLDERLRARFFHEQQLHARLLHEGIPQFHSSGTADGFSYFALEYVGGASITQHCNLQRSSLVQRLSLFRAVCEAVEYAHGVGVIHCDIKPKNILVKPDGSVRLLDFGVATPLGELAATLAPERAGGPALSQGLTPAYAAPEQLRGETVSAATDVHALGVVLYELLTLRHPYVSEAGVSNAEIARRISEDAPRAPSLAARTSQAIALLGQVHDDQWQELDRLVTTMLEKRPEQRFASVAAVREELERFDMRRARDAATAEAQRAARVQQFMLDLMSGGAGGEGHRKGMLVEELLHAAVRAAAGTSADPALAAEVLLNAGSSYIALGLLDRAQAPLEQALALHQKTFGADAPEVARDHLALGRLALALSDRARAESCARTAVELSNRLAPHDYSLRASSVTLLGDVLNAGGRHEEAVSVLEAALNELARPGLDPLAESALSCMTGNAHYYLGNYAESERCNLRSHEIDSARLSPAHPRLADNLINLGAIASDQGRYGDAERYSRKALEMAESFHGEVHPLTGSALTTWARALNMLERYEEAEAALRRAVAINEQLYPAIHVKVASTLHALYTNASMQGGRREEARRYAREVLDMERALHGEQHWRYGHALDRVGADQLEDELFEDAEHTFRQALAVYEKSLAPGHLSIAIMHIKIGRAVLRGGRPAEGEPYSLKGYELLASRTPQPHTWLAPCARDLVVAYEALGRDAEATVFRARAAAHAAAPR